MYKEKTIEELATEFTETLVQTNRGFTFYVNWDNALDYKEFEIELNAMNILIKSKNMEKDFFRLAKKLPTFIATFPLLFALSKSERKAVVSGKEELTIINEELDGKNNFTYSFEIDILKNGLHEFEIENYYNLFEKIGLKNLFENLIEKSVVDYVIGVLVGLDSNGRKNRGGSAFEAACEPIISDICKKYNIELISQKQFKVLKERGIYVSEDIENRKAG